MPLVLRPARSAGCLAARSAYGGTVRCHVGRVRATLVSGVVVAIFTALVTRGSHPWRELARARHELEVAELFKHDATLAAQLRERAHVRVELYLGRRAWQSAEMRLRVSRIVVCWTATIAAAAALLSALGDARTDLVWQVTIGACGALMGMRAAAFVQRRSDS